MLAKCDHGGNGYTHQHSRVLICYMMLVLSAMIVLQGCVRTKGEKSKFCKLQTLQDIGLRTSVYSLRVGKAVSPRPGPLCLSDSHRNRYPLNAECFSDLGLGATFNSLQIASQRV